MNRLAVLLANERYAVERQLLQIDLCVFNILFADSLEPTASFFALAFTHDAPDAVVLLHELALEHHKPLGAGAVDTTVQHPPALHGTGSQAYYGGLVDAVHGGGGREPQAVVA